MQYAKGLHKLYTQRVNNVTLAVKRANATGDCVKRSMESS